jgi:anti-anti-sigma factor
MIKTEKNIVILTPPDRLDTASAPEAEQEIISEIEKGASRIIIDLSGTSFVSSAGLRVILKVAKMLHQKSGALALCGLNEQITEVFEVSGFMTLVNVFPTYAEAAQAVESETP